MKLKYDDPLLNFAFNCNLRHYFPDLTTLNLSNNSIAFLPTQISSLKGIRQGGLHQPLH